MHTIERGYDLTTSQATILFVHGLNKELRKEMGRLLLIPGNTIKHWTEIPADESPEVSTIRLREYGELAQHLYTKMATEGDITSSSVISLFAVRDTGGQSSSEQANPIYEESKEEVALPGPPPLPSDTDSLSIIRDRRHTGDSPYRPAAKPFQQTSRTDAPGPRKKFQTRPGLLNPGHNSSNNPLPASLFGADTTERPPNLTGPTEGMLDQNGKPYKCYNCGRLNHIASGCKYQTPVDDQPCARESQGDQS
jgi:hypothetical protein